LIIDTNHAFGNSEERLLREIYKPLSRSYFCAPMRHSSYIGLPLLTLLLLCTTAPADPQLIGVKKISDTAPHSAFTDLAYFKDRWYCTFREGAAHVSPDGSICILQSAGAEKWDRIAHLTRADGDLRDPKLSITPDDRLMLAAAIALPKAGGANTTSPT